MFFFRKSRKTFRKFEMSTIIVKSDTGKVIQELPHLLPDEEDLFEMKKISAKHPGRTIERLTSAIFNKFVGKSNHIFDIKELVEDVEEETNHNVYDVCNVFEALGLVEKTEMRKYRWIGWEEGFISLKQLKTLAVNEDLKAKFLNPHILQTASDGGEEMKMSTISVTEKVIKLFLLLDKGESLSKDEVLHFVYRNFPEKIECSSNSGAYRISRVFKILNSLGLIQDEKNETIDPLLIYRRDAFARYVYVGPEIIVDGDSPEEEIVEDVM